VQKKAKNKPLRALIDEAIEEGLFGDIAGKMKQAVGLEKHTGFDMLPKDQWEKLYQENDNVINLLANTPGVQDAARVAADLLDQMNTMEAKKVQQQFRINLTKIKDPRLPREQKQQAAQAVKKLVEGLKSEADRIRSVRSGQAKRPRYESIDEIAGVITEDIRHNNGLI